MAAGDPVAETPQASGSDSSSNSSGESENEAEVSISGNLRFSLTPSKSPASPDGGGANGEDMMSPSSAILGRRHSRKASLGRRGTVFVPVRAGLSEQQVQELREVFALFDLDGSGKVAPSAVKRAASEAKLDQDSPEVWRLLLGLGGNEPVDFEEFVSLLTEPLGDTFSRQGISRMFSLFGPDAVTAGSVDLSDLRRLADELGIEIDVEDLRDMLEKAGAGADGRLDLDAFYSVMRPPS